MKSASGLSNLQHSIDGPHLRTAIVLWFSPYRSNPSSGRPYLNATAFPPAHHRQAPKAKTEM
jgi:hypothetical protein